MTGDQREIRELAELQEHPLWDEIYGDRPSEGFIAGIKSGGIRNPLKVVEDSHFVDDEQAVIMSGHLRHFSAKELGWEEVEVQVVGPYDTLLEERMALLDFNDQRTKTFSIRMREGEELEDIIQPLMEERQQAGKAIEPDSLLQKFVEGDGETTNSIVGNRTGIGSGEQYRKAKNVWEWGEKKGVDPLQQEIRNIDAQEQTVHGAHRKYTHLRKEGKLDAMAEGSLVSVDDIKAETVDAGQSKYITAFYKWLQDALDNWIGGQIGDEEVPEVQSINNIHFRELYEFLLRKYEKRYNSKPNSESVYVFIYLLEKEGYRDIPDADDEGKDDTRQAEEELPVISHEGRLYKTGITTRVGFSLK